MAAAVNIAAARLKASQENEFSSSLKIIGDGLDDKNWEDYKRTFQRLAYKYEWSPGLMDLDVAGSPWDITSETAEQKEDRKNIFQLLCATTGSYSHLLNAIQNGDAQGAWKAINDEFDACLVPQLILTTCKNALTSAIKHAPAFRFLSSSR
jgi:hypothetical protein